MKKILLLAIIIILGAPFCLAEDESIDKINSYFQDEPEQAQELQGHLEYNNVENENEIDEEKNAIWLDSAQTKSINISQPKSLESKSLIVGVKKPNLGPMQNELAPASKFATQEYNIKPVSTSYSKKFGKFSFGTTYDSSLSNNAQTSYSTGIFSKYENKFFALSTAYSKNTTSNYDNYNDTFSIAPELKLTKRLSLLDVMQTDVNQINKSNNIVLRYTPHSKKYADDVQLELRAGQSFYDDTYIKSSIQFQTKFKL